MNEKSKPNNLALLVIDVQQGLFERANPIFEAEQFLKNINTLITNARQAGVPVIFVQHTNDKTLVRDSDAWQLHPEIRPQGDEIIIHKLHGDAFIDTPLKDVLEEENAKVLFVTGLVTHNCVKDTSLGALDRGYQVFLISDGHSNFSKDAPRLIKKWNQTIYQKGAELIASKDVDFAGLGIG